MVEDLKCQLPNPPLPPSTALNSSPCSIDSNMTLPVSVSFITLPTGILINSSLPLAPELLDFPPSPPCSALKCFLNLKWNNVHRFLFVLKIISPPFPPSPPSGPPLATNFSLLKCEDPDPPFPDLTITFT